MSVKQAGVFFLVYSSLILSDIVHVSSPAKTTVAVLPDLYEVRDGHFVESKTADEHGRSWTQRQRLDRLEILSNDLVFNAPQVSCIEEKMTSKNSYGGKTEQLEVKLKFEDVHEQAGFYHVHRTSMAVRPHCEFDVVVPFVNSSKKARISGEFCGPEHITGGAAVGDYNGDGMEDIFFSVFQGRSVLYKNNGDGTFTDVTTETGIGPKSKANGAVWVDVDQDGDLDLYVTTVGDTRHYLYVNYGGHFIEEAMNRTCSLQTSDKRKLSGMTPNVGDFDNDGFLDIYVAEWIPENLGKPSVSRLLRNKGFIEPGYFEDVTLAAGVNMDDAFNGPPLNSGTFVFGSSFTDFDNDGWPELLVTADYGSSKMFWNARKGNFTECTQRCGLDATQDAMGHAIGDWDNDGLLDWFSSAIWHNGTGCSVSGCMFGSEGNILFRNRGRRQFEDATKQAGVSNGGWGWGTAFIDFNNDGFLDFIMTGGIDFPTTTTDDNFRVDTMRLWENLGAGQNGTTREVSGLYGLNGTSQGRGLLKWDYDDDGDEDVVVCNNIGSPFFYQNQQQISNNWLKIRVMSRCPAHSDSLCDSIGARVEVSMKNKHTQTQEIGSSTHFLGQSSIIAHFGLGRDSGNVTVKVTWRVGRRVVTYTDVPPNTRLKLVKPDRIADSNKTFPYSSLEKCSSLKILAITEQPAHSAVTINPDRRTVSLKVNRGVDVNDLSSEVFSYTASLVPSPDGHPLASNTSVYVMFLRNDNKNYTGGHSDCRDGRKIGPVPSATDERRLDGKSNNKDHVWWGAALEDVARELPAMYVDGIAVPAGGCTPNQRKTGNCKYVDGLNGLGSNRPSPRKISNELFRQTESVISARRLSDLHSHFGQFLAHDTDFSSPLPRYEFEDVLSDVWLPIAVPKGDVHFDPQDKGDIYLPFVRSTYNRCTGRHSDTPRQQVNKITSYIDGSSVYGSSEQRNKLLRTFVDGKMKLGPNNIIPENTMAVENDNPIGRDPDTLLAAGDSRGNVQPGLIALHTLFVREHNRLCDEYKHKYPQASDEQLFQRARRMVAAELQAITFREYLPSLLGGTEHIPPYMGYKTDVEPAISNIMATAAFRFGHSQVNTHLWRLEEDGSASPYGHLPLRDGYFAPERVIKEGGIDPILRGAVKQPAQEIDLKMVDDMRNALFPGGLDLAAMNIQRGRDHGLPDYNSVRKALGLGAYTNFADITNQTETASKLAEVYQDMKNVDLWVGGLAEDHEKGSELGPTFRKIVMQDFLKIRDGDRFWYEGYLSKEEIDLVHSLTLGEIIRLNTGFKSTPHDVFFSTQYCAGVENFQCVSRELTHSCESLQKELKKLRLSFNKRLETNGTEPSVVDERTQNDNVVIGLIVACSITFLTTVLFLFLFVRLWRRLETTTKGGNLAFEMKNNAEKREGGQSNLSFA